MSREMEEYNDDDEWFDDLAPLVGGSTSGSPMEIDGGADRRRQQYIEEPATLSSYMQLVAKNYKLIALLICMAIAPLVIGVLVSPKKESHKAVWMPSESEDQYDNLQCNTSFPDLMLDIEASDSSALCDPKLIKKFGRDSCDCPPPSIGAEMVSSAGNPRIGERWDNAFEQQKIRTSVANSELPATVDVALVGDSITEHWLGTDLGSRNHKFKECNVVYKELLTKDGGGSIDGIVVGISAERCRNVLYRVQNDAFADTFHPKVFWLSIGTNDIGGEMCNTNAVVAGNIAIVEELRNLRPDATVVVNGILPRSAAFDDVIQDINSHLECYAEMTEGVEYVESNELFRSPDGTLNESYYFHDNLHLNADGYRAWGAVIVEKVLEIEGRQG